MNPGINNTSFTIKLHKDWFRPAEIAPKLVFSNEFDLEIVDDWPKEFKGFKIKNYVTEEIFNSGTSIDLKLIIQQQGSEFKYALYAPKEMSPLNGWFLHSTYYISLWKIIDEFNLPFKVRFKGYKAILN